MIYESLRRFLDKSVSLRLIIVFILFLVSLVGFLAFADEVGDNDTLPFDKTALEAIRIIASPALDTLFVYGTDLGDVVAVFTVTLVIGLILLRLHYYRKLVLLWAGVAGASLISIVLKLIFGRERPDLWQHLVHEASFSFPSGHAVASSALALSVIIIFWNTRARIWIIIFASLYMIFIGFSRLYLGVHYPTDVAGGWLISFGWVMAVFLVTHIWRSPRWKHIKHHI